MTVALPIIKKGSKDCFIYLLDNGRWGNFGTAHDKGVDRFYEDVVEGVLFYQGGKLTMIVIKPTEAALECKQKVDDINDIY